MSKDPVLGREFLRLLGKKKSPAGAQAPFREYFFYQARTAIYHGLRALGLVPGDVVLLPSFLCAAAIEPLLAYGARVDFYRIDRDCRTDFADLEKRIRAETRAILAVHFFGFPCDIGKFRELCDRRGLFLIEDCAHVLRGESAGELIGTYGDISVFSWRKFLPVHDGGTLRIDGPREFTVAWDKENFRSSLKAAKNLMEQSAEYGRSYVLKAFDSLLGTAKRGWDRLWPRSAASTASPRMKSGYLEFDESVVNLPMSRVSQRIFERSDFSAIVSKRQENYIFLQRELASVGGIQIVFPGLAAGIGPWVFPVVFEGMQDAHLALRARGIPAVTWGGVRHSSVTKDAFPDADFLYEKLVLLPVHQDLRKRDLQFIAEESRSLRRSFDLSKMGNSPSPHNRPTKARTIG